jgi:hypothetical protein
MQKRHFCSIIAVIVLLWGCTKVNNNNNSITPGPRPIQIDSTVSLATQSIGVLGGTVTVSSSTSPLKGMQIRVPANAYSTAQTFSITSSAIVSQTIGRDFNPVSPLITINNGGGYSDSMITVTVPVRIRQGQFAMGFFYNSQTGKVEGLPVLSLTDSSITVGTRQFQSSTLSAGGLPKGGADSVRAGNLVIAAIDIDKLKSLGAIGTEYEPGVDDWEFTNYGSYPPAARSGHCLGQSLTSMWYYYERKLGAEDPPLFGRFKETPSLTLALWQDDPLGYRFASVVQADRNVHDNMIWAPLSDYLHDKDNDSLSWYAFAYSMHVTQQPQLVIIYSSQGGGHAMVVYGMDMANGMLDIADPNHPGRKDRAINYTNSQFDTYESGLSASSPSIPFEYIGYLGKSSMVKWGSIAGYYEKVISKTIGDDVFPDYQLYYLDTANTWVEIKKDSAVVVPNDSLTMISVASCEAARYSGTSEQYLELFDVNGTSKATNNGPRYAKIALKPGLNRIGAYTAGVYHTDATHISWDFLDFRWLDIWQSKLSILPSPLDGVPDSSYTFRASAAGTGPASAKWHWKVLDDNDAVLKEETKTGDTTFTYAFADTGSYTVEVELIDAGLNKTVGTTTASVTISSSLLAKLMQANQIIVVLNGMNYGSSKSALTTAGGSPIGNLSFTNYNISQGVVGTIAWDKNRFSISYEGSLTMGGTAETITGTIGGTIAASGTAIDTMTATAHIVMDNTQYGSDIVITTDQSISIRHFPLFDYYTTLINIGSQADSTEAQPLVGTVSYTSVSTVDGAPNSSSTLANVNFSDPQLFLSVYFTKK